MTNKEFLTVKDISRMLDITERTTRDLLRSENIKSRKVAGKYITTKQALTDYIEQSQDQPTKQKT